MATDTFEWPVRISGSEQITVSAVMAQFGDGYRQVAENGINSASETWNLSVDGHIPLPASIIAVADPFLAGRQNGGRIHAVNGRSVTLDRVIDYAAGDRLILNTTDGKTQTRTISAISNDKRTVTVSTAWASTPVTGAVWSIDSDDLAVQYYRVTSVMANDDGTFTVSGVQHDPNKFRYIDDGVRIESPPVTVTPIGVMKPPANIKISENSFASQGLSVASMEVSWDKAEGAIRYMAQWRKDNGDWVNVGQIRGQLLLTVHH
ncbi:phage tail protein [Erwinia persicina]|uniref:Phage tail protein n=1 Tax=Erwinia persicina TaxID=55211 RepID=A0ABR8ZSH6_9GAMM|nr:phage tail protein [Erwinia persicina]MBD8209722.1 phage tail protein [Erwinia persicina]